MPTNRGSRTLLKSLFRRTFPLLITQVVVTLVFCLFIKDVNLSLGDRSSMDREDVRMLIEQGGESILLAILIIIVNGLFSIDTILLQHSDSKSLRLGFPVNIYLLPMTFRRVAALHFIYGIFAVGMVTSIATLLTFWNLNAPFPAWIPVALSILIHSVSQAWAFAFGSRGRPLIAITTVLAGIATSVLVIRNETLMTFVVSLPSMFGIGLVLALSAALFEISISIGRGNRFRSLDGHSDARNTSNANKVLKPFRSPFWTQVWYECRTIGWVLPTISVALLTIYFFVVPILTGILFSSTDTRNPLGEGFTERFVMQWGMNHQIVSSGMLSVALGASVLTGAYLFFVSGEWRQKSTFLRTRPIATRNLASVRLTVLLFSTFCATAVIMTVFGLINTAMWMKDPKFDWLFWLRHGYGHISDVYIVLFFAGTLFVILWSGLWIVNVSLGISVYGVFSLMGTLLTFLLIQASDITRENDVFYAIDRASIWLVTLIWILGSAWIFIRAHQKNCILKHARKVALVLWLIVAVPFLYYGLGIRYYADIPSPNSNAMILSARVTFDLAKQSYVPFTHPVDWVLWLGLSLFPILPLFSLPYRLNTMRHN
jgi:hypothetical protein